MRNKEKQTAIWTLVICGCLCLTAVGAGVVWQAVDSRQTPVQQTERRPETPRVQQSVTVPTQPATAVQTKKVDETQLNREQQSNDPGEAPESTEAADASVTQASAPAEPVFSYPLQGEVVMRYSPDSAIYDPTLNQYRTHAAVRLSAETGAEVAAAEKGTVEEITKDEENGNSVAIAHGNGWLTTYSQLAEDISVKVGETVEKGQIIGTVGEPTKYAVQLGSHVQFSVEKDGEPVNPAQVVKK